MMTAENEIKENAIEQSRLTLYYGDTMNQNPFHLFISVGAVVR